MKIKNFRLVKSWPLLLAFVGILIFLPNQVFAVNVVISTIGDIIWSFFVYPMIWALNLLLELLKLVARYNSFTKEGGVILGWVALRDLSNMFFILIFLVIAFSTILRISGYGYNELLRRTIIIAILINFSKTIVGFIIDVSQVVMLTFVSAVNEALTGGVVVAVGLHKFTAINANASNLAFTDYVVGLVMGALLIAILLVVIGIMVMMLTMRIIALWIAIIMSPLAFLANIFPATRSFYNTWLKQLGSNLVTGPMLAFFLWLTFTIVGNGNAYNTFMDSSATASQGSTGFLETSNLINYIIAISLLLMGIKVAANSGAAGASVASKGMSMMKNTAGKLARRYPKALAQRAGAFAAGALVDKDGKAKTLSNFANTRIGRLARLDKFGRAFDQKAKDLRGSGATGVAGVAARSAGAIMKGISNYNWSKTPFYGGRIQRGAMNLKGKNDARAARDRAEDSQYIPEQMKEEFFRSQSAMPDKVFGSTKVAKALQVASSWGGGHFEAKKGLAEAKVDRDTIDSREEADEMAKYLEQYHDQPRLDKLHSRWANTNTSEVDVKKDLKNGGAKALLTNKEPESIVDKDGKATEGAMLIARTLINDENTDASLINKILLSLPKRERSAWSNTFEQLTNETIANTDEQVVEDKVDEKTGRKLVSFNNKGTIQTDGSLSRVKLAEINTAIHPQKGIGLKHLVEDNLEKGIESGELNFDDGAVKHLTKGRFESYKDFENRKKETATAWKKNNEEWSAVNNDNTKTEAEKEAATDKLFKTRRKLMGHYTQDDVNEEYQEINTNKQLSDDEKEKAKKAVDNKFYNSPAFKPADPNSANLKERKRAMKERAAGIEAELGPRPDGYISVPKKVVTDKEVDARAKEMLSKFSTEERLEKDITVDSLKGKARKDLEKEAEDNRIQEEKDANENIQNRQIEWDKNAKIIGEEIKNALSDLHSKDDPINSRLAELGDQNSGEIKNAIDNRNEEGGEKRLATLLAEQNSLTRLQNKLARKALHLETPDNNNLYSKGFLKNSNDGMDYSRLEEMDIQDPASRDLFVELVKVATQDQQRQILNAANPDQIKLLAETIVSIGGKMNKSIIDNLSPTLKAILNKEMLLTKKMEEGAEDINEARRRINELPEDKVTSATK